ncbi:hypothetical protein [Kitasatospora sp. NPDC051914]|uniref:hypothetical protein n=1 Tax=Kitasatospora sp. NPDC051914 TaxID=3154945 RepID=UPI003437A12D
MTCAAAVCRLPVVALSSWWGRAYVALSVAAIALAPTVPAAEQAARVLSAPTQLAGLVAWPLLLAVPEEFVQPVAALCRLTGAVLSAGLLTLLLRTLPRRR